MKAVRIHSHGKSDVLKVDNLDIPKCTDDKILVNIKACALNHLDIWVREGLPGLPINLPLIMGSDASGTIVEVGSNIKEFKVGDNIVVQPGTFKLSSQAVKNNKENYSSTYGILGETSDGTQAEYVLLNKENVCKMPEHLSFEESSSMQLVFMTSFQMIVERAKLLKDEIILIYGATSGVGSAAIQIAKDIGAKVISTVGSNEKIKYAYEMGSDNVFLHDDKLILNIRELIGKKGIDVIFEHVGFNTWTNSMKILGRGGRIVTCGATTGGVVNIDLRHLFMKQQAILGSTMANITSFNAVIDKINNNKYKPFVDEVFSFDDVQKSHMRMESREHFGKIVLLPT